MNPHFDDHRKAVGPNSPEIRRAVLAALAVGLAGVAVADPVDVTDAIGFVAEDEVLFPDRRDADKVEIFDFLQQGTGGPVTVGEIRRISQDVPVEVLQQAWQTAINECRKTRSKKIVNYCGSYSYTPTQTQCETGSVTLPSSVTLNCCTNFGLIDTGVSYPGCRKKSLTTLPGKANFTVPVPSSLRTFSIGAGIGPKPTQPAPADFDVGMKLTYQADVEAGVDLEVATNDGGLLDIDYRTAVTVKADQRKVAPGKTFLIEARHVPNPASRISSEYPAAGARLSYYVDVDVFLEAEYAYMDFDTGKQVRQREKVIDLRTSQLDPAMLDSQGRLFGEIFGLRTGLFEGLELRLMEGVQYRPPLLEKLIGDGYTLQIPPLPAGTPLPIPISWPFTCPFGLVYYVAGQAVPVKTIEVCLIEPLGKLDLALMQFQVPQVNTPVPEDFNGGVDGFFSVDPVAARRNDLDPATGALVNTAPSAWRPALNFDPTTVPSLKNLFGDGTRLDADYARFELDLDGLFSIASGTGALGVSIFGTRVGKSPVFDLELNSWDSDLVLWLGYDQELSFTPNLVADLVFDKDVMLRPVGTAGDFQRLRAGQAYPLPVGVNGASDANKVEVMQPPGGVTVTPVYSIRNHRVDHSVRPTTTFAWDNTFLQAKLGGTLGTIMSQAGFPFEPDIAALRNVQSAPPHHSRSIGSSNRTLQAPGLADVVGSAIEIAAAEVMGEEFTFKLRRSAVTGCKSIPATVTLASPAPAGGTIVTISDTLAAARPPASVTIPAGETTRKFSIKSSAVAENESGTVSATLGGTTLSQPLTLRPIGVASIGFAANPVVGGQDVAATVKLDCTAAPGDILVELSSTDAAVANPTVPGMVIPAGTRSGQFTVKTAPVDATTKPKIVAEANGDRASKALVVSP